MGCFVVQLEPRSTWFPVPDTPPQHLLVSPFLLRSGREQQQQQQREQQQQQQQQEKQQEQQQGASSSAPKHMLAGPASPATLHPLLPLPLPPVTPPQPLTFRNPRHSSAAQSSALQVWPVLARVI